MKMNLELGILRVLFLILVFPVSLIFEGLRRKLIARMQNRIGPPIWQPFYDVAKLLKKEEVNSLASENILFKILPILTLISSFLLFFFIPFTILSFHMDFILFLYIFILSGALYTLAGFASNSPFGQLGSMRDIVLMVCYETIFVVSIFSFIVYSNVDSIGDLDQRFLVLRLPLASVCLFVVALLESRITPLDTIEATTEIMGGVETEYSGKYLALLNVAKYLKFTFFVFLLSKLLFGFSSLLLFSLSSLAILFILVLSQATTSRYTFNQTLNLLKMFVFIAVLEFVRIRFVVW